MEELILEWFLLFFWGQGWLQGTRGISKDQWQLFLQALQVEALQRLESPEAADGWDEHLAVACDTLAGATFAWTSPPQVTAVLPGSLADGMVFEGGGEGYVGLDGYGQVEWFWVERHL